MPPRTILNLEMADQADMLGLLNRLHNLGLTVLSVEMAVEQEGEAIRLPAAASG